MACADICSDKSRVPISEDNLEGGGNSRSTHGRDGLQTLQGLGLGSEWGGTEDSQLSEWLSV